MEGGVEVLFLCMVYTLYEQCCNVRACCGVWVE